ncbi:MAG: ATP-binding protein [Actinomycetota bacterium]|nr:ATP-binding protein [Actinomycetota bacterium]
MTTSRPTIDIVFCLSNDTDTREELEADLAGLAEGAFAVRGVSTAAELTTEAMQTAAAGALIPLVFVDEVLPDADGVETLIALMDRPELAKTRKVLISEEHTPEILDRAIAHAALDGTLTVPWTTPQLKALVFRLVTEYFVAEAPEEVDEVTEVVDVDVLSKAFVEAEEQRQEATERLERLQRSFLDDRALSNDEVERLMIDEIDRALDNPPRMTVPAGTMILKAGDPVDGIRVVVDGTVHLTLDVKDRRVGFHARTAGRVIGLNAIARADTPALFNAEAIEETTFIPLTLEQLDDALRRSPTLAIHFVTVLLRAMARRNQRSIELRLMVDNLARDLKTERDELAETIDRLNRTSARLVESEKLATLGQLAAGVGHELNNPAAAISRSADFLAEDIEALIGTGPDADTLAGALRAARHHKPLSTREQRESRNKLAEAIGDVALAKRLVKIGVETADEYRDLFGDSPDPGEQLDRLERSYRIGTSLRGIDASAERIVNLVGSLRSYARPDAQVVEAFDVRRGIDETLLLLGHDLGRVFVETTYADDLPPVSGYPGELSQVWTNLITNAIQAMDKHEARLSVIVDTVDSGDVRVRVTDNGHGIPAADLQRIFEPAFTTKAGRVQFGLGLGLQIVNDIIVRHGGSIDVESEPGETCFTVLLPAAPRKGENH